MIYKLFLEQINEKIIIISLVILSFLSTVILLKLFKQKLPTDNGREFAYNGKLSTGKARGAGLIIVIVFILFALLFNSISPENVLYYFLIFLSMLSGFLDDCSKVPWGEYKKGLIDLLISFVVAITIATFNPNLMNVNILFCEVALPKYIFILLSTFLLWLMINATNCSDGIDGLCGTLSINSLSCFLVFAILNNSNSELNKLIILLISIILAYLWYNSEPSSILMGDAGSRAIGLFLGITILKTNNVIGGLLLCSVILIDGLLGIFKIVLIRFLKVNILKNIVTPLHDHFRKKSNWSNSQVIFRFNIIQIMISTLTIICFFFQ